MKIKELDRTVNISWSPASHHPILLAAGTAAQQLDASFSTSAAMEIYSLNLGEPGLDMELRASAPSDYRFHKITWSSCGVGPDRETGVIVGGCDGGRLQLYSASKLLSGEDGLIVSQEKHTGPVRALDFNPYQGNLLATGASESEIYVWDLNNMGTPMSPGAKAQPADDVVWIAWNRQVQHILASTFTQRCVVWDLRKNEPIIKLSDSTSRVRWKVVAWHPDVATQMCLASEDDQTPFIQLWDLRFATSPLKVMQNHQRGVLSIAWCAQDPDLLVSCGKDNRILCWNPNSTLPNGEVVCDIATTNQWHFDVSWCPRNPALIASSSFDGHVSVYSLTGGTQQAQTSTKIADSFPGMDTYVQAPMPTQQQVTVDLRKPPKWLRRPVGASFGFGGKLITFANEALPVQQQQQQQPVQQSRVVYLCRVVTEPELVARSSQLEAALQYGQFVDFCRTKVASSSTAHERAVWSFLRASFESNPRAEFLDLLGFRPDELNLKLSKFGKPANARSSPMLDGLNDRMAALGREPPDGDAAAAAFDAIAAAASNTTSRPTPPASPFKISVGDDINGLISQALLIGNIEAAVDLCLEDGRMADAIILAMTGGSDLLARTQYKYFQQSKGPLSSLISAVVTEDWTQVMQSCQIESWREALAAALTYSKNDELQVLCETLGSRIETEGKGSQQLNAQLCYICAGNLNKLIDNWNSTEKPTSLNKLQDFVELVMILQKAAEIQGHPVTISGSLAEFLSRYAAILASQGNLTDALVYLGNAQDEQVAALRDRIEKALGYKPVYAQPTAQPAARATRGSVSRSSAGFYPGQLQPQQPQQQVGTSPSYLGAPIQQTPQQPYGSPQAQPYTPTVPVPPVRSFTPTVAQQQQQQLVPPIQSSYLPGQHQSPSATSPYNPTAPVITQQQYGPPKTFSPAPPVAPVPPVPVQQSPPVAAVQGSNTGAGTGPRNKPYVIDPSVQSGNHAPSYGMQAPYGGQQVYPGSPAAPLTTQPVASYPQGDVYNPQEPPAAKTVFNPVQPIPAPPGGAPPGWNDPPVLKNFAKNQPKPEYPPQNPITHPLYGTAQPEPPAANYQNAAVNGVYGNMGQQQPYVPYNVPPHVQQQQQQQPPPPSTGPVATAKAVEPPKPKGPIPEEHMYLQTVFDELRSRCYNTATNPQTKRKLEEVARKLEVLYDCLREHKLSPSTLTDLHQMVQMTQIGDYTGGLGLHTKLVSGPDFSQIAGFMPGLKVLLQSALQLNVYLQ